MFLGVSTNTPPEGGNGLARNVSHLGMAGSLSGRLNVEEVIGPDFGTSHGGVAGVEMRGDRERSVLSLVTAVLNNPRDISRIRRTDDCFSSDELDSMAEFNNDGRLMGARGPSRGLSILLFLVHGQHLPAVLCTPCSSDPQIYYSHLLPFIVLPGLSRSVGIVGLGKMWVYCNTFPDTELFSCFWAIITAVLRVDGSKGLCHRIGLISNSL